MTCKKTIFLHPPLHLGAKIKSGCETKGWCIAPIWPTLCTPMFATLCTKLRENWIWVIWIFPLPLGVIYPHRPHGGGVKSHRGGGGKSSNTKTLSVCKFFVKTRVCLLSIGYENCDILYSPPPHVAGHPTHRNVEYIHINSINLLIPVTYTPPLVPQLIIWKYIQHIHGLRLSYAESMIRNHPCLQRSLKDKSLLASYGLPNPFIPVKLITLTLISLVKVRPLNTKEILWFLSPFIYRLSAKCGRQTADHTNDRQPS